MPLGVNLMKRRLEYEISSDEVVRKSLDCLKSKVDITIRKLEEGGGIRISNSSKSLVLTVIPTLTETRSSFLTTATVTSPELYDAVKSCFGDPKSETKLLPTILDITLAINKSSATKRGDLVSEICGKFGITEERFESYQRMIHNASRAPTPDKAVTEAVRKLRSL